MINKIKDIQTALNAGAYLSALALALTLPDICSQVEDQVTKETGKRYIKWINNHFDSTDFQFPNFEKNEFGGEMCYALRCKVLHEGNTNVEENQKVFVDSFQLTFPGDKEYFHGFKYTIDFSQNPSPEIAKTYIGIDYLCEILCKRADEFYNNWGNKTDFDKHRI